MKNSITITSKLLLILLIIFVVACGKDKTSDPKGAVINPNVKGGVPEKIIFSTKTNQNEIIEDIVQGDSDIFLNNIPKSALNGLTKTSMSKLELYTVPSETLSFILNPIPNKAPYQIKVNGVTKFNPFAIRKIRYALNFLMDRKYIVDEILNGAGGVKFTPTTPSMPNAWKFELQAKTMGMRNIGDKKRAVADIDEALQVASKLPENINKLIKKNGFWNFEGKPVTLKFVIRTDDSEEKIKLGNHFATLIESAGIKVEKSLCEESQAVQSVYHTDPAELKWQLYTESSVAKTTNPWQDNLIIQSFSSIFGNQPGWDESSWWNYKNIEADKLAKKWYTGKIESELEHWDTLLKIDKIGLTEAIRVFVAYQSVNNIANKARFKERMYYGLETGIDRTALENAKVKDGILKVLQNSPKGGLYQSSWDPIGTRGFVDNNSSNVVQMVFDNEIVAGPFGQLNERRSSVISNKSNPIFERDINREVTKVFGKIAVDENAILMNPKTKKYEKVGKGIKAAIETTFKIDMGVWHHGRKIKKSDYLYPNAFIAEWAFKDDANDEKYDSAYSEYWAPTFETAVGQKWNTDGTVTMWSNKVSPKGDLASVGELPSLRVNGNQNTGYAVPWEEIEAIQALVVEGSASNTKYGFTQKKGVKPIDLKSASFIKDLRAKLVELANKKYVPPILTGEVTPEEATSNYKAVIKFIDTYGHALIGYGPYMLTKLDVPTGFAELTAFRDMKYTEEKGKWGEIYKASRIRIDNIKIPKGAYTGKSLEIIVNASELTYPSDKVQQAAYGMVYALFINKDGEVRVNAAANGDGTFTIKMEAETTKTFKGYYTLVILGALDSKFIDTKITDIMFK